MSTPREKLMDQVMADSSKSIAQKLAVVNKLLAENKRDQEAICKKIVTHRKKGAARKTAKKK